jgi:hypothetical protein
MKTFIQRMHEHYNDKLHINPTPASDTAWQQIETAVLDSASGAERWQIVQLPTGTGKTEAIKVLCAMQTPVQHPGALIVTKLQAEATRLASSINEIAGWKMAHAQHGEAKLVGIEPAEVPVLIVTHAAYRLALRTLTSEGNRDRLNQLLSYQMAKRSWLVIDEAFDWVDTHEVDLSLLRMMPANLTGALAGNDSPEITSLRNLADKITQQSHHQEDRRLSDELMQHLRSIDLLAIEEQLTSLPDGCFPDVGPPNDAADFNPVRPSYPKFRNRYADIIRCLQAIVCIGHAWTSKRGGKSLLQSSRLLIDCEGKKGIILDATAAIDRTYELRPDLFHLVPAPQDVRRYDNVTLHVSSGHRLGKHHLAKNAQKEWPIVYSHLLPFIKDKRTLICAHKDAICIINSNITDASMTQTAHWGRIDGINDWRCCEVAIIFGLPYIEDIVSIQKFIAFQGAQPDSWFSGCRKFGISEDVIADMSNSHIARTVTQAINRIRCRTISDEHGNCAPTDIYLLLPNGRTGACVQNSIISQMPGIKVRNWETSAAKRKPRKVETSARLVSFFQTADAGYFSKADVIRAIGANARSFERFVSKFNNPKDPLSQSLTSIGVFYHSSAGRGRESLFLKNETSIAQ